MIQEKIIKKYETNKQTIKIITNGLLKNKNLSEIQKEIIDNKCDFIDLKKIYLIALYISKYELEEDIKDINIFIYNEYKEIINQNSEEILLINQLKLKFREIKNLSLDIFLCKKEKRSIKEIINDKDSDDDQNIKNITEPLD